MQAARAAIAERQQTLAASRALLEERESALRAAQERRRTQLADLQGKAQSLVKALSTPHPEPAPDTRSGGGRRLKRPGGGDRRGAERVPGDAQRRRHGDGACRTPRKP